MILAGVWAFKQIWVIFDFQSLEVVVRGSETQPQVIENLNRFT